MQVDYKKYEETGKETGKEKSTESVIHKTKDYNIFKLRNSNRDISERHVKILIEAIKNDNNLHLHPIIVNADWEVIDGQHRLLAARKLNVEIYYIKDDNINIKHIVTSNVNQNKFKNIDYIKYFCLEDKNINYIIFSQMMEKTGLSPKSLQNLLNCHNNDSSLMKLTNGEYIFENTQTCTPTY